MSEEEFSKRSQNLVMNKKNLQDLEDLPYEIVPGEVAKYRDSIYIENERS